MSNNEDNNTPKPHNYYDELTPAQREEWDKRMKREEEEKTKTSLHSAEVKRLGEIGKEDWIFNKAAKAEFTGNGDGHEEPKNDTKGKKAKAKRDPIVKAITEDVLNRYRFLTIEESREVLVYDGGVYTQGGEVTIEKTAESLYGYKLANRYLAEIKGHIMRRTYHKRKELDSDINIVNLKNGLYNIETDEFKEHSPDYLSITQKPFSYNRTATTKLFGKYISEVLYPGEIRTAIELMAYTLYRDNPFEIIVKLFGYGANGKSVYTGLLTALHGSDYVSNVSLSSMQKNTFALSDLEKKYVNIDTELPSATLRDTTVLKKLTGRQPVRIERKNQRAYDTVLYAKLFFSANKIPEAEDESDAYFRREIIISFPNRFDGKSADPNLLKKLSTEEELAGIFNMLIKVLRTLLKCNGVFINEGTIEQRRQRHELAINPVPHFLAEAVSEESNENDTTYKDVLYNAYVHFCHEHKLAVMSDESFGRAMSKLRYKTDRDSTGVRKRFWIGIRPTTRYLEILSDARRQRTLDFSESEENVVL
jgi:P4 family phage/plasmid primase-like protien